MFHCQSKRLRMSKRVPENLPDQHNEAAAAQKRLQQLDQLKDEFLASVSHELRTPLTNLKIYLRLLEVDSEKNQHYVDTMSHELNRLQEIVESILTVAQLMKDIQDANHAPVNLADVLTSQMGGWKSKAEQRNIQFDHQIAADLPVIMGEAELLIRAIYALLDNSIKYTPSGGKNQITVAVDEMHKLIILTLKNNGPWIPKDELPHIFDRFFRGKTALEERVAGAGTGLYVAFEIIKNHGGSIEASNIGSFDKQGVKFIITLPVSSSAEEN